MGRLPMHWRWVAATLVTSSIAIGTAYVHVATGDRYTRADHDAYADAVEVRLRALESAACD